MKKNCETCPVIYIYIYINNVIDRFLMINSINCKKNVILFMKKIKS